ncbi:hypothetical protein GCM10010246_69450 [Streptomyces cuspidosporus]|uniref:Uncharacterized protein n=1 Tax=Streptomyces cuspidosporus TaxID=66882 RepID=A0ABP5U4K3_9ACTN
MRGQVSDVGPADRAVARQHDGGRGRSGGPGGGFGGFFRHGGVSFARLDADRRERYAAAAGGITRAGSRGRVHAGRVAPAKGIWSMGATRTGAPGRGAWIMRPSPM